MKLLRCPVGWEVWSDPLTWASDGVSGHFEIHFLVDLMGRDPAIYPYPMSCGSLEVSKPARVSQAISQRGSQSSLSFLSTSWAPHTSFTLGSFLQ